MTSAKIQDQINEIETKIQQGATADQVDQMNGQLADLKVQLATAKAEEDAQAERTQAQTEAVNAIVLPLDFNELFDNTAANDTIIEVVREFQAQAYADHNTEIAQVNADWQSKIKAVTDNTAAQLSDLQKRLDSELLQAQEDAKDFASLEQQFAQIYNEKKDAEQKRDAAAQEIIRLNSHIDDLQQQLANAPAPKAAIEIGSTDRLNELAARAKESNAEKAARGLARWNEAHAEIPIAPLDIPTLPQIAEEPAAATTPQEIPTATPDMAGNTDTAEVVGAETEATIVTREEHEALKARVTALESVSGRVAA